MKLEFKEYSIADRKDVIEMMTSFNAIDDYKFDPIIGGENLDKFTANEYLGKLYLIIHGQRNIGYIILAFGYSFEYKGRDAFIDEFYVKKEFRNQGIGKKTIDFIEVQANKLEVKAIHLEVEGHNEKANSLYKSKGYQSNNRTLLTKKILV